MFTLETKVNFKVEANIKNHQEETEKLKKTVEALQQNDAKKSRMIERLQYENSVKEEKIQELMTKVDSFEQNQYEKDVQLVGLSESADEEDDIKQVQKLAHKTMGMKINVTEVEEIIRLGKKSDNKARDTIIRFKSKKTRDTFYSNRKKSAASENIKENVYVNDRLTSYRKNIFYAARQLFKQKRVTAAWTQHGNVLVRKTPNDGPKQIHSHKDLEEFRVTEMLQTRDAQDNDSIVTHISDYDFSELSDYEE